MPADEARILAALPQTQCTRCGYPDCAGYARAIATAGAAINQCPPGGSEGVARLALITGKGVAALNPGNGVESPRALAIIDEAWCIGCTLCLAACPTDAIFGSHKLMHSVIEAYCTGCGLCVPVCPVDCIALENTSGDLTGWAAWSGSQAQMAQTRYKSHRLRLIRDGAGTATGLAQKADTKADGGPASSAPAVAAPSNEKQIVIAAALARARARRGGAGNTG